MEFLVGTGICVLRFALGAVYTKAVCRLGMAKARTRFESREGREAGWAGASPFLTDLSIHGKQADDVQERSHGDSRFPNAVQRWRFHDFDVSTALVVT